MFPLSHTFIPLQRCHSCKNSLHSADPLQDPGLGCKKSLLAWVRIKPKSIAKHLTSWGPFQHQLPQPITPYLWCLFLGSSYGRSCRGSALCMVSWFLPQRCREEEERCLHMPSLSTPLIKPLYVDISFSRFLLQFITINAVACWKARPFKLSKFNTATWETEIMMDNIVAHSAVDGSQLWHHCLVLGQEFVYSPH